MKRRDFIMLLCGAAAWPHSAPAQQSVHMRRLGVLLPYGKDDPESRLRGVALGTEIEARGWKVGQSLAIDYRWEIAEDERARVAVAELLGLKPDVILASAPSAARAAQQATHTVPIVFNGVSEPVELGLVASLAHPGGNVTGFTNLEPSVGAKWLELLKEIAPTVTRVAMPFNTASTSVAAKFLYSVNTVAPKFAVEVAGIPLGGSADIEPVMAAQGSAAGTGLIIPLDGFLAKYYRQVVELAARYRLPAIYPLRQYATAGGLISYGANVPEQFRRAAVYIDRILRGEKPDDLPVQQPTKFEMVINLKAAKVLGLQVPDKLLALADDVID